MSHTIDLEVAKMLDENSYTDYRNTGTDRGIVGISKFIFTTSIVCRIDKCGYSWRFCYHTSLEAVGALRDWAEKNYEGEPDGFIVRKGRPLDMEDK